MAIQHKQLRKAFTDLTMLHPFWATIVMHHEIKPDPNTETFSVDGKIIRYNPELSEKWSVALNMFALAHEAGHVILHHLARPFNPQPGSGEIFGYVKGKPVYWDRALYYRSGDYLINDMLKKSGFTLWDKCLWDAKYDSSTWTTEAVYRDLDKKNPPQKPPQGGCGTMPNPNDDGSGPTQPGSPQPADGNGLPEGSKDRGLTPDKMGHNHVAIPADTFTPQEAREIIMKAAAIAKAQGKLPASIEGLIKECIEPQYPVYRLLERFLDVTMQDDDSSWRKPHRDYFSRGIVMPSEFSERVNHVVVVYDTSGSVPDEDLSRFHRITGDIIRRAKPAQLTLMECDAAVHRTLKIKSRNDWPSEIKMTGRGGTSFKPPFEQLKTERVVPTCLIYLTDLCGDFPDFRPTYPVLWVSTMKSQSAPFGTVVYLNE